MNESITNQAITAYPANPASGPPAPSGPSRAPALAPFPDALGILKAFRRRWPISLALGLFMGAAAWAAVWAVLPQPKYTARATLHVSTSPRYIIFDPKERLSDYRTYQRTQIALARSRFVVEDVVKKPEIASLRTIREAGAGAPDWISEHLTIAFPDGSEVLEFALIGERPDDLTAVVNAMIDSYLLLVVEEEQKERKARLENLKKLKDRYQELLQAKRGDLRRLTDSIGSNDRQTLTAAHQLKLRIRDVAEQERMRVGFELKRAEARIAVLEVRVFDGERAPTPAAAVDERVAADPGVRKYEDQVRALTSRYNEAARLARSGTDPATVMAWRNLDAERRRLAAYRAGLRPTIAAALRDEALRGDREELNGLRAEAGVNKTYKEALDQDLDRLQAESKAINRGGFDLSQKQEDIQVVSETARKIAGEVEAMEVELGAPPRIRPVDRAAVPKKEDELRKVKASGAAAAGTFLLALFGVCFWEFRAQRIGTVDEVVHGLGLPVYGALPHLSRGAAASGDGQLRGRLLASIDATRAMILHASALDGTRTVMITSAMKGEGKTSLASHLAASLARSGRNTLLVDCDLRSPSLHRIFDLPGGPGLSEVLRGEADAADLVRPTRTSGLCLLAAGRGDDAAIDALAQDRARAIFDGLKARYDFVVVDSAPVLPVADSLLVCRLVDAVIFAILRDVSRVPLVYAAHERLKAVGARTLGAVVNGAPSANGPEYHYPAPAGG
jgi:succinoglycan biosynthesis transport protein ExoP